MMKRRNRIAGLCAALFALTIVLGVLHTSPALAWDTWPAGTHNDPNHTWTVVFDKAMNTATINSQNIYVSNDIQGSSRVGGVSVRASNSTHALVSPPAGGWKSGASYYLIITQKVLTSANRPLKDEVRMPFHIKAITKAVPTVDVINNGLQMIVKVNGTQLSLQQPPYTVSGHPMVPIKEIAQALGAAVDWDAKNKRMTIMGDKVAELTIGSKTARVNGAAITLEVPAAVTAGTIMAPLSFLQPAMGAKVNYTATNTKTVLTPNYFIPDDISKVYVISTTVNPTSRNCTYNSYVKWKGAIKYTYEGTDFDIRNSTKDEYIVDGNELKWIGGTLYSNGNGHDCTCISGSCVLIKPVSVGEKWDNNYVTQSNAGNITWAEERQFVGMENIRVMGSNKQCAHVRINGICREESSQSFVDDYWLVKGIGAVKVIHKQNGVIEIDELIKIQ